MHRYIHSYNHKNEIAVLVEFRALDDYTVRTDEFQTLATDICLHIAACDPASQANGQEILALLNQRFVKNQNISVRDLIDQCNHELRGRISIVRYVRFHVDDGVRDLGLTV